MTTYRPTLDDRDAQIIGGALSSSYTYCLDAMANSAGASHGYNWPETEPRDVTRHRDTLDRIERIAAEIGHPIDTSRRPQTEEYYARTAESYWVRHLVASHDVKVKP